MKDEPAFPFVAKDKMRMTINTGMSMRDYFAAHAMMVLFHGYREPDVFTKEKFGALAYEIADQMLKARGE